MVRYDVRMRVELRLPRPLLAGRFVQRVNRFAAEVVVAGQHRYVHLPNSGRLSELLIPGVLVRVHPTGHGRTWGTLLLVHHCGRWVGVDSQVPNRLWETALRTGGLPPVCGVLGWEREVSYEGERLDFRVQAADGVWLVETKSCNRVEDRVALFPDAPTARGARHLRALARAVRRGMRAAMIWFIQRDDARRLRLDVRADPELVEAGREALHAGVVLCAYACSVTSGRILVRSAVPVDVPLG